LNGDFLERLVARSFEPTGGLRPRPAALFEPARPVHGLPLVTAEVTGDDPAPVPEQAPPPRTVASEKPTTPLSPPRPRGSPLGPPPRPDLAPPRRPPLHGAGELAPPGSGRPAPTPPAVRERAVSEPTPAAPTLLERVAREVVAERTIEAAGRRAPPPLAVETPERPPTIGPVLREVVVEGLTSAPRKPEPAGRRSPRGPAAPRPGRTSGPPGAGPVAGPRPPPPTALSPRTVRPAPVVVEPRVEGRRHRAEPATPAPAAPPPVHVTIGRVEVRASTAAAEPVGRPRPRPQVMSLDEYLDQRSHGGSGARR
jgi:hypothetical protein